MLSPSRLPSQEIASGFTASPADNSGNHFRATATAASARAGDGSNAATSAAPAATSFSAAAFTTPPTACARLLPERLDSHHANAWLASVFAEASTERELSRARVRA